MSNDPLYFFEQTDFSLRFARCTITETALNIEELKELSLSDPESLQNLAPAGSQVICALRPKSRQLHLASIEESSQYAGLAGVQQFAQLPQFAAKDPAWFSVVQAADGSSPGNNPWLLSLCPDIVHQQSVGSFEALKLKPARCSDALSAAAGALATTISSPILLLEIGELASHALVVSPGGVIAVRSISLNLDQIAEAVQNELQLKFKGSAAKLFFNPDCDFTESGAKIAARLGVALQAELAPILTGQSAPTALCCTGLPAQQHWLETQLAATLNIPPFTPDIKGWCNELGVTFANPELEASVSPAWFNFLYFINAQTLESSVAAPWQADWIHLKTGRIAKPASNPPIALTTPASASPKASVATGKKKAQPPTNKPTQTAVAAASAVSSVHYSAKPTVSRDVDPVAAKSKLPVYIGVAVLVIALLGGGYFYLQTQQAETARIALAKQQADQKAKAEAEKARLAEQKAKQEAENRKKFEFETSQKLAAAQQALEQAEEEARLQAAARLANARGTMVIATQPAGATVTVDDLPPRPSPATFNFLKIGKHSVTIALPYFEEQKMELEVEENQTTAPKPIQLTSKVGSVSLTSEPSGSKFELRPSNSFSLTGDETRTGQTPASLDNISPGDYTVTFSRAGWTPHTVTLSVARNEITRSSWSFPSGSLSVTSSPAGATVSLNGEKLGVTPLIVRRPAGLASYKLELDQYDPVTLSGKIEDDKTLELTATLHEADILYNGSDLDKAPEPINPRTPDLPSILTLTEGRVVIQLIVNRDGSASDLQIVRVSNPEIGRLYLAALAKWKFKPGIKNGKPVRTNVVIPFLIQPSR